MHIPRADVGFRESILAALLALALVGCVATSALMAQETLLQPGALAADASAEPPDVGQQLRELAQAAMRLTLAGLLATALALRPRRRGTPERKPAVIQTQVILAVIGALVMLVVGTSLARAFGIVGAAGLVRYRAKIDDPKDAGVMLSTLAIGLASGVGLWVLAIFGTVFILLLLWAIESFEPMATRRLLLKVKAKNPTALKPKIERFLRQRRAVHEIRGVTSDELHYEVRWPLDLNTDDLSERIVAMDDGGAEVELEQMKG